MKLRKFNRKDCNCATGDGMGYITIEKGGIIRLNRKAAELLNLKIGDKLDVLQDEERTKDWYLAKTSDENGLVMRRHSDSGSICSNAKVIADTIRKSLNVEQKTLRFRIAPQPAEESSNIYAILTSSAL